MAIGGLQAFQILQDLQILMMMGCLGQNPIHPEQ